MTDNKIEIIRRKYEAFGRGDTDAVLEHVADDVDWVSVTPEGSPAVPWYGRYRGLTEVPRFFKEIGSSIDITEFTTLSFTSSETDVMVAIRWAFTVKATGRSAVLPMQHWWRLADGKVVAVQTAEDSERTAAAFV